ncbi:MAG: hypothetical protein ACREQ5_31405 [Candidatus Dormibacteria bacterium]
MPTATIIEERTVRRLSPFFFIGAVVCFFFTFAGVSCNTDAARTTLHGLEGLGGNSNATNAATIDKCVTALQGYTIATYSGFNLVLGGSPSVLSTSPPGCPANAISSLPGGGSVTNGNQVNIGVQPLALAAFIAVAIGVLVSEFGFFGLLRAPFRGVLTTLLAVAGIVALVVEQAHLQGAITTKISSVTAGVGTTFNVASYFNVTNEPAYFVALGLLGAAALYNAVSAFFVVAGPEAEELPPPEMGLPPPSGMRPAWPGLSPAGGWWRRSARSSRRKKDR